MTTTRHLIVTTVGNDKQAPPRVVIRPRSLWVVEGLLFNAGPVDMGNAGPDRRARENYAKRQYVGKWQGNARVSFFCTPVRNRTVPTHPPRPFLHTPVVRYDGGCSDFLSVGFVPTIRCCCSVSEYNTVCPRSPSTCTVLLA